MRTELENIEKIELYLSGKLIGTEKLNFEKELENDQSLKQQLEIQQLIQKATIRQAIKADVLKYGKGKNKSFLFLKDLGIIFVLLIAVGFMYFLNQPTEVSENTINSIPSTSTTEKESEDIDAKSVHSDTIKIADSPVIVPSKAQQRVTKSTTNTDKQKQLGGLKTWLAPDVQRFNVNPSNGAILEGKNGTLVIIPSNAFVDEYGNIIRESVLLEMVEALKVSDMIAYNLTTMSGEKPLTSGGMVHLEAESKGKTVLINPDRPIYMEIPTDNYNSDMKAWEGIVDEKGNIDWQNPKELTRYLTTVDFDLLDFIPEGFADAVEAGLPFKGHDQLSDDLVNTLYYSLVKKIHTVEKPTQLEEKRKPNFKRIEIGAGRNTNKKSRQDPINDNTSINNELPPLAIESKSIGTKDLNKNTRDYTICHIDPMSIKTIKTDNFTNTFIATKEFEQRLKVLHKIPNSQKYFDLYINNLNKNLWEVDEMVAKSIGEPYKKEFVEFLLQKHTNVEADNIYQAQLSAYYNETKKEFRKQQEAENEKYRKENYGELDRLRAELNNLKQEFNELDFKDKMLAKGISEFRTTTNTNSVIQPSANRDRENANRNRTRKINPSRNVATSRGVYATNWFSFGWVNIDAYLKNIDRYSREVVFEVASIGETNSRVYQCINTLKTIIPLNIKKDKAIAKFPKAGTPEAKQMENTYAIGISRASDEKIYFSKVFYNPYKTNSISMNWKNISSSELKSELQSLDVDANPLINLLEREEECIHNRKAILEQKQQLNLQIENTSAKLNIEEKKMAQEIAFINSLWAVLEKCKSENNAQSPKSESITTYPEFNGF